MLRGYVPEYRACGDGVPSVKKSPINQRISPFLEQNRCVFLFSQSDDIIGDLPQGIGFGEREVYILAKGYFLTEEKYKR